MSYTATFQEFPHGSEIERLAFNSTSTVYHCFLWCPGTMLAFFKDQEIEFPLSFMEQILLMPCPWTLFRFIPFILFTMLSSVKARLGKDLSERKGELSDILLLLLINEHWQAKEELKSWAFCLKSVINLSWWNIGGRIKDIF